MPERVFITILGIIIFSFERGESEERTRKGRRAVNGSEIILESTPIEGSSGKRRPNVVIFIIVH
jgi:hypothetical protein